MAVSTRLKGDQEKSQTNDGQGTTDPVNALQNIESAQTLSTHMCDWEVSERKTTRGDSVVDQGDPHAPSPCVTRGEQLAVEHIWGEWEYEGSQGSGDIATVLDRHGLVETTMDISMKPCTSAELLCLPSKTSQFTNTCTCTSKGHANNGWAKGVRSADEDASNNKEHGPEERDVALANQIIEVTNEWTDSGNGKRIRSREPSNDGRVRSANVRSNEAQATADEVQRNLRACKSGSVSHA